VQEQKVLSDVKDAGSVFLQQIVLTCYFSTIYFEPKVPFSKIPPIIIIGTCLSSAKKCVGFF